MNKKYSFMNDLKFEFFYESHEDFRIPKLKQLNSLKEKCTNERMAPL